MLALGLCYLTLVELAKLKAIAKHLLDVQGRSDGIRPADLHQGEVMGEAVAQFLRQFFLRRLVGETANGVQVIPDLLMQWCQGAVALPEPLSQLGEAVVEVGSRLPAADVLAEYLGGVGLHTVQKYRHRRAQHQQRQAAECDQGDEPQRVAQSGHDGWLYSIVLPSTKNPATACDWTCHDRRPADRRLS